MRWILLALILSALPILVAAEEIDPFSDDSTHEFLQRDDEVILTSGTYEVELTKRDGSQLLSRDKWPKIGKPTNFNRHFVEESQVWKVQGGYFSAFDYGEFGGALFFAGTNEKKWTRVVNGHVQDLVGYNGECFLAAGGLAHMGISGGAAYLIARDETGGWTGTKVFISEAGVPMVIGFSSTDSYQKTESKKLIVIGLKHSLGIEPLFGLDSTGVVHYLGQAPENKTSEQVVLPKSGRADG